MGLQSPFSLLTFNLFSSCSVLAGSSTQAEHAGDDAWLESGSPRSHPVEKPLIQRPSLYSYLFPGVNKYSSSSTAADVVQQCGVAPGTCVLVTGACSEVGSALCNELCKHGATVLMGFRSSQQACAAAAEALNKQCAAAGGRAVPLLCDLSSLKTAQQAAEAVQALDTPVHALIHCASHCSAQFSLTPDGVESHFAINFLNPLLLTLQLLPLLSSSCEAGSGGAQDQPASSVPRVVWATCSAHHITYMPPRSSVGCKLAWRVRGPEACAAFMPAQAFGQSKLAVVMAARLLAQRAAAAGIPLAVFAVHPGITQQGLTKYAGFQEGSLLHGLKALLAQGLAGVGLLKTPQQAAASLAYAALSSEPLLPDDDDDDADAARVKAEYWAGKLRAPQQHRPPPPPPQPSTCSAAARSAHGSPYRTLHVDVSCDLDGAHQHMQWEGRRGETQDVATWWAYCEDCSLSAPSVPARSQEDAEHLWQLSESCLLEFLGPYHSCPLLRRPHLEEGNYSPFKQQAQLLL